MPNRRDPDTGLARRGTSNGNQRGSAESRRRRKLFLLKTYPADVTAIRITHADRPMPNLATARIGATETYFPSPSNFHRVWATQVGIMQAHGYIVRIEEVPCCRCYRCGDLLTFETMTVDRITPGCVKTKRYPRGGTYVRENIRPACSKCNTDTGAPLAAKGKFKPVRLAVKVVTPSIENRYWPSVETVEFAPPEREQQSA